MKEPVAEYTDTGEQAELWRSSEEMNKEEKKRKFCDGRVEGTFPMLTGTTFLLNS